MRAALWADNTEAWADDVAKSVVRVRVETYQGYPSSAGTGFIVSADQEAGSALAVTAYHVVEGGGAGISVFADDGYSVQRYGARNVGYDAEEDIALLYICCSRRGFFATSLSTALPDDWFPAFFIGFGGTLEYARVVSSEAISEPLGIRFASAPLPADSGSPIFNSKTGEVVGIMLNVLKFLGEEVGGSGAAAPTIAALLDGRPGQIPVPTLTPTPSFSADDAAYLFEIFNIIARWSEATDGDIHGRFLSLEPPNSPRLQRITAVVLTMAKGLEQLQPTDFCQGFYDGPVSDAAQLLYGYVEDQEEATLVEAIRSMAEIVQSINSEDACS